MLGVDLEHVIVTFIPDLLQFSLRICFREVVWVCEVF